MTTIEFLHRIGRRAREADFTKLSLSEKTDLLESANAALGQVYNALPIYFKELTQGFLFPAPVTLSLAVTNNSRQMASDVFTSDQLGRTVVLPGDPAWNQIIATDELLNPYLGPTGTVDAIIYGDAVYSTRSPFDRIVGNPRFNNQQAGFLFGNGELTKAFGGTLWPFEQNVGRPVVWWTQPLGNSQGNSPILVLKVAPAPDRDYVLDVRLAFWAKRLTLTDYTDASALPVPDQFLETALIPLAVRNLMSTPVWVSKSKADDDRVEQRALEATIFLKNQPAQMAPNNKIFCPVGY